MFFTQELRFLKTEAQLKGTEVRNVSGSVILQFEATHTTYSWTIKWQKCAGISVLWVLNEIFQKKYPENMKEIKGAVWKLPAK